MLAARERDGCRCRCAGTPWFKCCTLGLLAAILRDTLTGEETTVPGFEFEGDNEAEGGTLAVLGRYMADDTCMACYE